MFGTYADDNLAAILILTLLFVLIGTCVWIDRN
jgi:hypothetical protein